MAVPVPDVAEGQDVVYRYVHRGQIRGAYPARVVSHTAEETVFWIPAEARGERPEEPGTPEVPAGVRYRDGRDWLIIARPDQWHDVCMFFRRETDPATGSTALRLEEWNVGARTPARWWSHVNELGERVVGLDTTHLALGAVIHDSENHARLVPPAGVTMRPSDDGSLWFGVADTGDRAASLLDEVTPTQTLLAASSITEVLAEVKKGRLPAAAWAQFRPQTVWSVPVLPRGWNRAAVETGVVADRYRTRLEHAARTTTVASPHLAARASRVPWAPSSWHSTTGLGPVRYRFERPRDTRPRTHCTRSRSSVRPPVRRR